MTDFFGLLSLIFLVGAACLTATSYAMNKLGSTQTKDEFQHFPHYYFYFLWIQRRFAKEKWSALFDYLRFNTQFARLIYAGAAVFYGLFHSHPRFFSSASFSHLSQLLVILLITAAISILSDFLVKLIVTQIPYAVLKLFSFPTSLFLLAVTPILFPLFWLEKHLSLRQRKEKKTGSSKRIKRRLLEFLQEPDIKQWLSPSDQKLLTSFASFKDRITKEIMIPRIDLFTVSADDTIEQCIESFIEEGYSRVPIYQDNIDNITGILLYKNLLKFLFEHRTEPTEELMQTKIRHLITPALFAPESKKISHLLQDFKNHQSHLAIIVDEYGGTEGIVTIEDILEELVGEIADEYDSDEKALYVSLPSGGWIVDAKMSIIDIEKELHLTIPEAPEYETIGGYIFHKAGAIPSKGWCIHHEHFDLEVIASTDRSVEKIKITPTTPEKDL